MPEFLDNMQGFLDKMQGFLDKLQGFLDKIQGFLDVSRFWNSGGWQVCLKDIRALWWHGSLVKKKIVGLLY